MGKQCHLRQGLFPDDCFCGVVYHCILGSGFVRWFTARPVTQATGLTFSCGRFAYSDVWQSPESLYSLWFHPQEHWTWDPRLSPASPCFPTPTKPMPPAVSAVFDVTFEPSLKMGSTFHGWKSGDSAVCQFHRVSWDTFRYTVRRTGNQ